MVESPQKRTSLTEPAGRASQIRSALRSSREGPLHDGVAVDNLLHLKVLRSPHAHARIRGIDTKTALAIRVLSRFYLGGMFPAAFFSTALHEDHLVDPDDHYVSR